MFPRRHRSTWFLWAALLSTAPIAAGARPEPADRWWGATESKARFALRWRDDISRLRIVSTSVLPGGSVAFAALGRDGSVVPSEAFGSEGLRSDGFGGWTLTPAAAPELHEVTIRVPEADDAVRLNVWVEVPRENVDGEDLDGYHLGLYPKPGEIRGTRADPPPGFVRVTEAMASVRITPHFTLGQFLCKQHGGFPKYTVLNDRLPLKLEALLERVREKGIQASSLRVMSGFRTPAYNHSLGNVVYSRHLWGAAADVFVDESPRDGVMDDLNGDGRMDRGDTDWLARLAESLDEEPVDGLMLIGGVGRYGANGSHGPFVHIDVRARPARW